jgi:hypothetical protein
MNKQKGLTLGNFILWCVVISIMVPFFLMVIPAYLEYRTIMRITNNIAKDTVLYDNAAAIRSAFDKQADIDSVTAITSKDLKIKKDGALFTVSFEYEKRYRVVGNISMLIEYKGSTR